MKIINAFNRNFKIAYYVKYEYVFVLSLSFHYLVFKFLGLSKLVRVRYKEVAATRKFNNSNEIGLMIVCPLREVSLLYNFNVMIVKGREWSLYYIKSYKC